MNDNAKGLEHCCICDEPTGRAGRGEGSIYCDVCEMGPFCPECWDEHHDGNALACRIRELECERDEYKEIAIEFAKDIMHHVGIYIDDDSMFGGYYDSVAMTAVKLAGDFLVEEAGWERHPCGLGRRWFYRPKAEEGK